MHITVAGKQVDTGEALRTHVRDGLSSIAQKYFDRAVEANVTFRRDHGGSRPGAPFFACDINLKAGRNLLVRAEGDGVDAHRAFDDAAGHLAKRLRRHRRRFNEHARSLAEERAPRPEPETARESVLRAPADEGDEAEDVAAAGAEGRAAGNGQDHGAAVIAEMPTEIDRLTVGEAAMRLDLAQLPVLMFRNRANGALNVVYRRADGHVGWIDPASG